MRRSVYGLILMLLLVSLFISASSFVLVRKARATITVPDDFLTIQEAINNASIGDAIYVRNGTYYEHLWIYKRVLLVGENQNTTIIDGNGTGTVVSMFSDDVWLSNFTIRNGTVGLHIEGSRSNILRNNHLRDNDYNFLIVGGTPHSVEYFIQDIDTSNLIEGNPMYYLVSEKDVEIPEDAGYVAAVQCTNITVRNLNLTKNGTGVLLVYSNNSLVENVHSYNNYFTGISLLGSSHSIVRHNRVFSNGWRGIVLWYSTAHSNLIYNNTIAKNGWASGIFENGGIVLVSSGGNTIYHNNFTYNKIQAEVTYGYTNVWDNGYPAGGNYWSDYTGADLYGGPDQDQLGSDGIGDSPYVINENNTDNYPLIEFYTQPQVVGATVRINPKTQTIAIERSDVRVSTINEIKSVC